MNKARLKSHGPQARQDFIAAFAARANLLGISGRAGQFEIAPAHTHTQGHVTLIPGQGRPTKVGAQRDQLITRMRREGCADTWCNRLVALGYMALDDHLAHGHRVLSSAEGVREDACLEKKSEERAAICSLNLRTHHLARSGLGKWPQSGASLRRIKGCRVRTIHAPAMAIAMAMLVVKA